MTKRRQCRLPSNVQRELIERFVKGSSARSAAVELDLNRHSVRLYYQKLRETIFEKTVSAKLKSFSGHLVIAQTHLNKINALLEKRGDPRRPVLAIFHYNGENYLLPLNMDRFGVITHGQDQTELSRKKPQTLVKPHSIILADPAKDSARFEASDFLEIHVDDAGLGGLSAIFGPMGFWTLVKQHIERRGGISKSQVSRLCKEIDERVQAFLNRPIEGDWPYVWLDATYIKCREGGHIVSKSAIVAVGVNTLGERAILGLGIGVSEAEQFWSDFLRGLTRRGLRGVRLVIADHHAGLTAAADKVLGAPRQPCRVHWMRNMQAYVGVKQRPVVIAMLKTIFAQETKADAQAQWQAVQG